MASTDHLSHQIRPGLQMNTSRPVAKRALRACSECSARKRHCDMLELGGTCTYCLRNELRCFVKPSKRRNLKGKTKPKQEMNIAPYQHQFPAVETEMQSALPTAPSVRPEFSVWHPLYSGALELRRLLDDLELPYSVHESPLFATGSPGKAPVPPQADGSSSHASAAHSRCSQPDILTNWQSLPPSPPGPTATPLGFAIRQHGDSCIASEGEEL
ncbi:hypothetical protein BDV12DRAFT_46388 [Aspergillus spectabilis]